MCHCHVASLSLLMIRWRVLRPKTIRNLQLLGSLVVSKHRICNSTNPHLPEGPQVEQDGDKAPVPSLFGMVIGQDLAGRDYKW